MKRSLSTIIGLCLSFLPFSVAGAAQVTYNFTGAISEVGTPLFPTFTTATPLSGSISYNTSISDSNANATVGQYTSSIQSITIKLGSTYTATLGNSGTNSIEIQNQTAFDQYSLQSPLAGNAVNGYSPVSFKYELVDPSAAVFTNDSLPTNPPSLASFATNRIRIVFDNGIQTVRINGSLSSLSAVPIPPALLLFGAGLVALVGFGAGGLRIRRDKIA